MGSGLITPQQLRHPRWTRLHRDVFVAAELPLDVATRCRAVALVLPRGAAVSGRSAAWWHGAAVQFADEPIEVTVPRGVRMEHQPGVVVRQALLPAAHVVHADGVAVCSPERAAFDVARRPDVLTAVAVVDALLAEGVLSVEGVLTIAGASVGWRGVRQVPRVMALADGRAESPPESRVRAALVLGGLPTPEVQWVVRDRRGRFIGRLDLAYPAQRLGLEYDGAHHHGTRLADEKRDLRMAEVGWQVLRLSGPDLADPGALVARVRNVLAVRTS